MTEARWLVIMALPEESQGLLEQAGAAVVYTGIGKVNATYGLTRALYRWRASGNAPVRVLNLGTAGSHVLRAAALVECTRFVQHDMDVSALGFPIGTTPFESDLPATLSIGERRTQLPAVVCYSSDRFITARTEPPMEAIDMEAYALAKVCLREAVKFTCVKFISDGANGPAASGWAQTLEQAAVALSGVYRQITGNP